MVKKLDKYSQSVSLYASGLSIQDCANFYGISRQAMHSILKRRGCTFRERLNITKNGHLSLNIKSTYTGTRNNRKCAFYNGKKFTLRNNGYFAMTTNDRILMHRYVWEKEKGKIPIGWDIHHINEDKEDNRIENLECLPKAEHTKLYSPHNNQYTKGIKNASNKLIRGCGRF